MGPARPGSGSCGGIKTVSDEATRVVIRPTPVDDARLHRSLQRNPMGSGCVAARPERWVRQTDFSNDEAVGLPRRTASPGLGVEERARRSSRRRSPGQRP